ncbi:MAG: hypothetical protein WD423_07165 [Rhodothermales bacterium]
MPVRNSWRLAAPLAAILLGSMLVLAGCDTIGTESVTLRKDVNFRFEFSTEGREAGTAFNVDAVGTVDFGEVIAPEGFTTDEIIAVNVHSVSVQRVTPVGTNLDAFDRIALALVASGVPTRTVAELEPVPSSREATLPIVRSDVTQLAVQPSFRGRLTVVPAATPTEQYVLTARMEVVVEVEGV